MSNQRPIKYGNKIPTSVRRVDGVMTTVHKNPVGYPETDRVQGLPAAPQRPPISYGSHDDGNQLFPDDRDGQYIGAEQRIKNAVSDYGDMIALAAKRNDFARVVELSAELRGIASAADKWADFAANAQTLQQAKDGFLAYADQQFKAVDDNELKGLNQVRYYVSSIFPDKDYTITVGAVPGAAKGALGENFDDTSKSQQEKERLFRLHGGANRALGQLGIDLSVTGVPDSDFKPVHPSKLIRLAESFYDPITEDIIDQKTRDGLIRQYLWPDWTADDAHEATFANQGFSPEYPKEVHVGSLRKFLTEVIAHIS